MNGKRARPEWKTTILGPNLNKLPRFGGNDNIIGL
jgi:hypothetical protein